MEEEEKNYTLIVAENIKNRREELGLSQDDLAKRLGLKARASICDVERERRTLTTPKLIEFAEALECSPSYLMGWEEETKSNRLEAYYEKLKNAYRRASRKNKKAVCLILNIEYEDE